MSRWWKYFLFLFWISYLFVCGVLIFTRGFLLSRQTLPNYSACGVDIDHLNLTHQDRLEREQLKLHSDYVYRCRKTQTRVIFLVIDALKYDFAEWDKSLNNDVPLYKNKIPIFNEMLESLPNNSRLLKFIANPPTTTLQRLKGITTGSLPTFIDAGFNFAAPEISEDNLLYQVKELNKEIVLMGDDVWVNLFPGMSLREYAYPSFDMFDLDTVDSSVERHLKFELQMKDWTLLVAHFLGVDHCGHAYGPSHPEMSRKLTQMNSVIRSVIDTMDENTVLFVMGDHGMTSSGDHGGDSEDEVLAALFLYSPTPLLSNSITSELKLMYQVDLVPTVSYMLGLPIPYSNLGKVILELLPQPYMAKFSESHIQYATEALVTNIEQIMLYIHTYSRQTALFSKEKLTSISRKFHDLHDLLDTVSDSTSYNAFRVRSLNFLNFVRESFEEVWVQFDSFLMSRGLVLTFLLLSFVFIILESIAGDDLIAVLDSGYLLSAYCIVFSCLTICFSLQKFEYIDDGFLLNCVVSLSFSIFLLAIIVVKNWKQVAALMATIPQIKRSWVDICTRLVHIMSLLIFFSNSYVVEEGQVLAFLILTLVWTIAVTTVSSYEIFTFNKSYDRALKIFGYAKSRSILLAFSITFLLRLSYTFWREEQKNCVGLNLKNIQNSYVTLFTLAIVAGWITALRMWFRSCGNLMGFSLPVSVVKYMPSMIVVFLGGSWVLRSAPRDLRSKRTLPWQQYVLPRIIYGLLSFSITCVIYNPLCTYLVNTSVDMIHLYGKDNVIPQIFKQMRDVVFSNSGTSEKSKRPPVIYGLATVYSTAIMVIVQFMCLFFTIVLADFLASSVVLMFSVLVAVLIFLGYTNLERIQLPTQLFSVPWTTIVLWGLLSSYFFYATGHQPAFPNIHWYAAFVGMAGQLHSYIIPAILIGVNTYCSQALFSLCIPLLVISPFTMFHTLPHWVFVSSEKCKSLGSDLDHGEMILLEKPHITPYAMFKVTAKYILFHATRIFACMLAASLHCRHLMVWKIFAPRFMFEGLSFLVTIVFTLLGFLLISRISTKVERLISNVVQ